MTQATRAELQRLLAAELERRGWTYDLTTVPELLNEVERAGGNVDPQRLANNVSGEFLDRSGATRADMTDAIAAAIGDRTLIEQPASIALTINDNRYSINAAGAHIIGSNLNTGSQIAINGDSPADDVLDAVATLVTAGLGGEWNVEAADDLAQVVGARQDITYEDVRQRTLATVEQSGATGESVKRLLTQIAAGAVSGALGTGIVAGLGALT